MRCSLLIVALAAACGGGSPYLVSREIGSKAFAAPGRCGQGPYVIEAESRGSKWGENAELQIRTPRRVRVTAVVKVDGEEKSRRTMTVGPQGWDQGDPENQRCVATESELQAAGGGAGGGGGGGGGGAGGGAAGGGAGTAPPALVEAHLEGDGATVLDVGLGFGVPTTAGAKIRFEFWFTEPNDLEGVVFALVLNQVRPNVSEAKYEAYLRKEQERRRRADERAGRVDPREQARLRAEASAELKRAEERARREQRRQAYCDTHHDDTACWGPGGFSVYADLQARVEERKDFCKEHHEDARCWSQSEWSSRLSYWRGRLDAAEAAGVEPPGGPPFPQADTQPPKPSEHAEWRPGYYHWDGGAWLWIGGQWRVPESDLQADLTTHAPSAPPEPKVETPPPAPATVLIWIPGYWAWDGRAWVWVPGSWQLAPEPNATWQPPRWEIKASGTVLLPGGWVVVH